MRPDARAVSAEGIMLDFARRTGLEPAGASPRRYLWTDAFAVCNFLGLFQRTGDTIYRDLALKLVAQVHHTLGRHRDDDARRGWISGLSAQEGGLHPTRGGLRIGKRLGERGPDEAFSESREWDRDGQYFHYLTKWMHALNCASRITGEPAYVVWASELAQAAHAAFTYVSPRTGRKMMCWKMSIDLTRPLVPAMGQHDPLDGLVTYSELQAAAKDCGAALPDLAAGIADLADICRESSLTTDDPLGLGGLLCDAARIARLMLQGSFGDGKLLAAVVAAALTGLETCRHDDFLKLSADCRLAFRELGLAIGLQGVARLPEWIRRHPDVFGGDGSLERKVAALLAHQPLGEEIGRFWMDGGNRHSALWREHAEINMVMLATSLAPDGFLLI